MFENQFLPDGYVVPKIQKPSQFLKITEGKTVRIRIVSPALRGYLMFDNKTPIRKQEDNPFTKEELAAIYAKVPAGGKKDSPMHFWAFIVYDRDDDMFKVLEITQTSIKNQILEFSKDADWGSVYGYDLKISRKKENGKTSYGCLPCAREPLSQEILASFQELEYDLEALFRNEYPIKD